MARMKKTAEIRASVEEVWRIFAYPENVLRIFDELKHYETLSKNRIGEGATYGWIVRYFGKDFEIEEKITGWREHQKLSGKNMGSGFLDDYSFNCHLEPIERGTRVTVEITYELPYSILGRVLDAIAIRWVTLYLFHKSYKRAFENAKKLLSESHHNQKAY